MYAQPAFRMTEQTDAAAFVDARRFATRVVSGESGPVAAHLPMILHRDADGRPLMLEGHVARSNPVATIAATGAPALAVFQGADAYVTPSLYLSKREHGRVVPTWNYIAVQAAGALETFTGSDLRTHIEQLTDAMEGEAAAPWAVSDAPGDYIDKMVSAITGVRLRITTLEGVRKVSQNRAEPDRASVQHSFSNSPDPGARALAEEMTKGANRS
jgi:transcriptional regulator